MQYLLFSCYKYIIGSNITGISNKYIYFLRVIIYGYELIELAVEIYRCIKNSFSFKLKLLLYKPSSFYSVI